MAVHSFLYQNENKGYSENVYFTLLKIIYFVVFTHGVWMGGWVYLGKISVCAVSQKSHGVGS